MALGRLICFGGPPCSGKSSLGQWLQAHAGYQHLNMDEIRQELLPDAEHTRQDRQIAYGAMHLFAERLVRLGHNVICDASYQHRSDRAAIASIVKNLHGVEFFIVQFHVPEEVAVAHNRLRAGHHPAKDLDEARVRHLVSTYPFFASAVHLSLSGAIPTAVKAKVLAAEPQPELASHVGIEDPVGLENPVGLEAQANHFLTMVSTLTPHSQFGSSCAAGSLLDEWIAIGKF